VDWAGQSQRVVAAALIVALHAGALYALAKVGPESRKITAQAPVLARIIEAPDSERPKPQPPLVLPEVTAPLPEVQFVEIPINMPSAKAITVAVQTASAPSASRATEDRSAPKLVSSVEYLREPSPRYPPQSRRLREQGLVVLKVLIDERGNACEIEVESSSGYARLDHAAREAVQRAAFRPYIEDGAPRRALVLIPIEFSLNRTSA
jgi:protein TonB